MIRQIDVDVMTMHGEHYYGRMKTSVNAKPAVAKDGSLIWIVEYGVIMEEVARKFPTLKGRNDIVIYKNEKNNRAQHIPADKQMARIRRNNARQKR